jgi:hypothetical protein
MTRIVVDDTLRSKLHNLTLPLELCDTLGRVVARLTPVLDPNEYALEPQISREELRRRMQSKGKTCSTAEVLAHLENL